MDDTEHRTLERPHPLLHGRPWGRYSKKASRCAEYSRPSRAIPHRAKSMRRVTFLSLFATVAILAGENFNVDDVNVVGDLKYGQTSAPVECSGVPSYCAFVFNGQGDDRIQVDVSSVDGKAFVAIADGALAQLTSGTNRVLFSLPRRGPDAETYYIVFRDRESKPQRFTVALKKLEK
jgi:hypothetical protein